MNSDATNIPIKFFGLNKHDVNKSFQEQNQEYESKLKTLMKQKKLLERELEKLLAELAEANKEVIQYEEEVIKSSDEKSQELIHSALDRLKKSENIIDMIADEEIEQLRKNAKEKLAEYEETIRKLHNEIDESKEHIESTLLKVTNVIKSNMAEMVNADENDSEKSLEKRLEEIKGAVKSAERLAINEEEKVTADGTSLNYINKISTFKKKYFPSISEEEEEMVEKLNKKRLADKGVRNILNYDFDDEIEDQFSVKSLLDQILTEDDDETEDIEERQETQVVSSDNEDNIKAMRNALIIGKIAGEDLHDNDNNIIVPKNKILSPEDVALAEEAGKLPELIINMQLPE